MIAPPLRSSEGHYSSARIMGPEGRIFTYWRGAEDPSTRPDYGMKLFDGERKSPVAIFGTSGEFFEIKEG